MKIFTPLFTTLLFLSMPVQAGQENQSVPSLPEPLQRLVADGAQVRYLGQTNGLDGWVTIRQGQEQYFYVTPDKRNFIMGLLFNDEGRLLTLDQVQTLRQKEGDTLDLLAEEQLPARPRLDEAERQADSDFKIETPAEQLYRDVEQSNWVSLGNSQAPFIYTIIDPQCPHCHAFVNDLKADFIEAGRLQLRMVPIGVREETRAQAAFLLAAPNPEEIWFRHLAGDETALPAKAGINQQGVQHNLSIIENWRLDVTPITIYRDSAGVVKIIRGRAQNPEVIMQEITG